MRSTAKIDKDTNTPVKEVTRHNVNNQMQEQKPATEGTPPQPQDPLHGRWQELKGRVQTKWNKLSDDDLTGINGNQEELVKSLQVRYKFDQQQAEKEVREFLAVGQVQPKK